MNCIIDYAANHPFSIANLPYGSFYTDNDPSTQRCGVAIGDWIVDLKALSYTTFCPGGVEPEVFRSTTLNLFMALSKSTWLSVRLHLQSLLTHPSAISQDTVITPTNLERSSPSTVLSQPLLIPQSAATMCLPCTIGDYTDFYTSIEHATNCGTLLRGRSQPLLPNWKHLPVAYHGRCSSIVVSGTPIRRPVGQILDQPGDTQPVIAPCRRLDFELEVGFFYGGKATQLGERLSPEQAEDRVFGAVLLNDWSARDIQSWEYVPLGPFLSKNFATTITPWIVPIHALEPFTCPAYTHTPPLLEYLQDENKTNFDIPLQVGLRPQGSAHFTTVSESSLRHTYYTIRQMIAHHSTTGCPLKAGDLMGTGTLSAPGQTGCGSLLEKCWAGKRAFALSTSTSAVKETDQEQQVVSTPQSCTVQRTFLEDGDEVVMTGLAIGESGAVGFGECLGKILPAISL